MNEDWRNELITKGAAYDALNEVMIAYIPRLFGGLEEIPLECAMAIIKMPSAQPEKRTEEHTETHACDSISRPQPCKDAVSKADVLETYAELYDVFDDNKEIKNELHKIYDKINALKAAQPQRRKGRWIDVTKTGGAELWKCSECGELELEDSYFCPNCGSDNRGEDDEVD